MKTAKDWSPARRIPINPTTPATIDPENPPPGRTVIACPASAKWANLFNVRYRNLLTYLAHTFRLARLVDPNEPNTRGAVMAKIFGEMYNLKAIAGILVRMPLTEDVTDPRRAGPPFQMPYTVELPLDDVDCWRMHRDISMNSLEICDQAPRSGNKHLEATPPEGKDYLLALRSLDEKSISWIDKSWPACATMEANTHEHP